MPNTSKTAVPVVFGAMTFGAEGAEQARVHDLATCAAILDVFQRHGHDEVDTSRTYGAGTSEQYLGDLGWQQRHLVMDTKFYPTAGKGMADEPNGPKGGWRHIEEHMRRQLDTSLKALKTDKVPMWYLHGPDRTTPYEETLKVVNDLHKEGKFERFGISNYMAWEVAQIVEICERNGWIKPSVYQGVYNALHRTVEYELFPCLRKYGIAFYEYNPLGGGYLTDRYHREDSQDAHEKGSRFDPDRWQGRMYRARYWNDAYFDALDILRPVAKQHNLTEAECALRWMQHHSQLKKEHGDTILIGASSVKHIEQNLVDMEKGPLPDEVVKALDQGWERTRGVSWRYFH